MTFSRHFGYLKAGVDFDGHLWLSDKGADCLASASQMPWLGRLIDRNPLFPVAAAAATALLGPTLRYVEERYAATEATSDQPKMTRDHYSLDKFLEAQRKHPDVVDRGRVVNMLAGADTTAIAIKAVLYYARWTPGFWQKLVTLVRNDFPADLDLDLDSTTDTEG